MSAVSRQPPIRSALKKLHQMGAAALQPQPVVDETSPRTKWTRPVVSRRMAKDLRKQAIKEGTYGSFDINTGKGWDSSWDLGLYGKRSENIQHAVGNINWMEIRGYKETKRERTRESRAKKIESLLEVADEKIVEFRQKNRENKPEGGIENIIKIMMRSGSK